VQGLGVWPILSIFSVLALIVATFVSHSIASVLVASIAARIGDALDPPHPRLLIMATALICSSGMALPVSGFPNLMAVNLEDDVGQRYLTVEDFLKTGVSN
jgi:phosphate transporter